MIQPAKTTPGKHRKPVSKATVAGAYARYIGRVGALAVALGIGTAVGTMPGVSWAGPEPATPSDSGTPAAPSDPADPADGPPAAGEPPASPDPGTTDVAKVPNPAAPRPGEQNTVTVSEGTAPPATLSATGGANTAISVPTDEVDPEDPPTDPDALVETEAEPVGPAAAPDPQQAAKDRGLGVPTIDPATRVAPSATMTTVGVNVARPAAKIVSDVLASRSSSAGPQMFPGAADTQPMRLAADTTAADTPPAPTPSAVVEVATRLVSSILSPLLGNSPNNPSMPTLAFAVLAFVRREFDRVVTGAFGAAPASQTTTSQLIEENPQARTASPATASVLAAPAPATTTTSLTTTSSPNLLGGVTFVVSSVVNTVGGLLGGLLGGLFNQPPKANPIVDAIDANGVVTGRMRATDPNKDKLTYSISTQAAKGTASVDAAGNFAYTPSAVARHQASATPGDDVDKFTVKISDGRGGVTTVEVKNVPIMPKNAAPQNGRVLTLSTPSPVDGTITGTVKADDLDNDTLTYSGPTGTNQPTATSKGTVTVATNGSFTYTPATAARGVATPTTTDIFNVNVNDGHGGNLAIPVSVNVLPTNKAPVATAAPSKTDPTENGSITVNLNVIDPEGKQLTYTVKANPTYGGLTANGNGTFTYTPDAEDRLAVSLTDAQETDTFTIRVTDEQGAYIDVPVSGVIVAELPANSVITAPNVGAAPVDTITSADGITYIANSGSNFVSVLDENDAPAGQIAVGGNPVALALTADGSTLYVARTTPLSNDVVSINTATGQIVGAPIPVDGPTTSLTLSSDGQLLMSTNANKTITLKNLATNTAPVRIDVDPGDGAFSPDHSYAYLTNTDEDSVSIVSLTGQSPRVDIHVGDAPHGIVLHPNGTRLYVTVSGEDRIAVIDLTANNTDTNPANDTVTYIDNVGDDPRGIDITSDGTKLVVANFGEDTIAIIDTNTGTVTKRIPVANGPHAVDIHPDDAKATVTNSLAGKATVVLLAGNNPPAAVPHVNDPDLNGVVTGSLNATDADNDDLTYSGPTNTAKGHLDLRQDGTFTYTPTPAAMHAAAFTPTPDTDTFVITINDGHGQTLGQSITVTIQPNNNAPTAVGDTITTNEDAPLTLNVTSNDNDPDGDTLTVASVSQPSHGLAVINADGTITYTPGANYYGTDSFTYTVSDGADISNVATVTVNVIAVNDDPVAVDDSAVGPVFEPLTIEVLANDTDADGDTLTATVLSAPTHGALEVNPDGTYTYRGFMGYSGPDSFTYTVSDGQTISNVATVSILLDPTANNRPTTYPVASKPLDSVVTVNVNAFDMDGDTLTYVANTPTSGSVTNNGGGTFTYTPSAAARTAAAATPGTDNDSFTITVSDGRGGMVQDTITVEVAPTRVLGEAQLPFDSVAGQAVHAGAQRAVYTSLAKDASGNDVVNIAVVNTATGQQVGNTVTVAGKPVAIDTNGALQLTPDGSRAVITTVTTTYYGSDAVGVSVIDTATGLQLGSTVIVDGTAEDLRLDPDGRLAILNPNGSRAVITSVVRGDDNFVQPRVTVIDTVTGQQVGFSWTMQGDFTGSPQFSSDGTRVAVSTYSETAGFPGQVLLVNTTTGMRVDSIPTTGKPAATQFSPDSRFLAVSYESEHNIDGTDVLFTSTKLYATSNGAQLSGDFTRSGHANPVLFSADSSRVVYTWTDEEWSHKSYVLFANTAGNTFIGQTTVDGTIDATITADGSRLLLTNVNNSGATEFRVYNGNNGALMGPIRTLIAGLGPEGVVLSPDQTRATMVTTTGDTVQHLVIDTASGNVVVENRIGATQASGLVTSNGTRTILNIHAGDTTYVSVVDNLSGSAIGDSIEIAGEPISVLVNEQETFAAVFTRNASGQTAVSFVNLTTGTLVHDTPAPQSFDPANPPVFNDGGTHLIWASPQSTSVEVTDIRVGDVAHGYNVPLNSDVEINADGTRIISVGPGEAEDGSPATLIDMWDNVTLGHFGTKVVPGQNGQLYLTDDRRYAVVVTSMVDSGVATSRVVVVNMSTGAQVGDTLTLAGNTRSVDFAGDRVLVSVEAPDDELQVVAVRLGDVGGAGGTGGNGGVGGKGGDGGNGGFPFGGNGGNGGAGGAGL